MAKVEGRDSETLRDLANVGLAGELDSRLRDLERNIAVAKEFIKLADESYSEVRREWSLLQQDLGNKTHQPDIARSVLASEKRPVERSRFRRGSGTRQRREPATDEAGTKETHNLTRINAELHRTKVELPANKEPDVPQDSKDQTGHGQLKRLRPRAKG